jgi:hypothetical protein
MAEITKLSVNQALNKLRGTDVSQSRAAREDEALHEEMERLRTMKRRLQSNKPVALTDDDPQEANAGRIPKRITVAILLAVGLAISILAWGVLS